MHVLQIIDTLAYGGAQKLLVTFAQQARERGIRTTVLSLYDRDGAPLRSELEAHGARVVVLRSRHLFDPGSFRQVVRAMREDHVDVVHTHLTYANINGGLTARLNGLAVVGTLHALTVDPRYANALRDGLEHWSLRHLARRVLAVGESVAAVYRPILRRPIDVIPNAVPPPAKISPAERVALRTELAGDPSRQICMAVGRFSPAKGYGDLLDAFAEVHRRSPRAVLALVGDGAQRQDIEARIAALGLGLHVKLCGLRNDVLRLLSAADVYVNASHWEGLPIAHLEAMAAGLPVVATSVGDAPHVVVQGTGLLVPARAPEQLAAAILAVLDDPARAAAMGRAAHEHVTRCYGASVWFERLLDLYKMAGARI